VALSTDDALTIDLEVIAARANVTLEQATKWIEAIKAKGPDAKAAYDALNAAIDGATEKQEKFAKSAEKARDLFVRGGFGGEIAEKVTKIGQAFDLAGNASESSATRLMAFAGGVGLTIQGVTSLAGTLDQAAAAFARAMHAIDEQTLALARAGVTRAQANEALANGVALETRVAATQETASRGYQASEQQLQAVTRAAREHALVVGGTATQATQEFIGAIESGNNRVLAQYGVHLAAGTRGSAAFAEATRQVAAAQERAGAAHGRTREETLALVRQYDQETSVLGTLNQAYQGVLSVFGRSDEQQRAATVATQRRAQAEALAATEREEATARQMAHQERLKRENQERDREVVQFTNSLNAQAVASAELGSATSMLAAAQQQLTQAWYGGETAAHALERRVAGLHGVIEVQRRQRAANDSFAQNLLAEAGAGRITGDELAEQAAALGLGGGQREERRRGGQSASQRAAQAELEQIRSQAEFWARARQAQTNINARAEVERGRADREKETQLAAFTRGQETGRQFDALLRRADEAAQNRATERNARDRLLLGGADPGGAIAAEERRIERLRNRAQEFARAGGADNERRAEALQAEARAIGTAVDGYVQLREAQREAADVSAQFAEQFARDSALTATAAQRMAGFARSSFDVATSAAENHARALLEGRENAVDAAKAWTHEVTTELAIQAGKNAVFALFTGIFQLATYQYAQAALSFAAAAGFGALAVGAGAISIATNTPPTPSTSQLGEGRPASAGRGEAARDSGSGVTQVFQFDGTTFLDGEHAENWVRRMSENGNRRLGAPSN
jgi:hypothetical protein